MTADLRWYWARLNANYWFYPMLFAIGAAALAFWLVWLDRNGFAEWLSNYDSIVPARPDGAANVLTVMAAAMIGVASTVFSITIAAVAYASNTYGPRLLTNFLEDRGNQFSLATFIGTFVYAFTVLRTVRAEDEAAASIEDAVATSLPGFVPQLSLVVAYLLMAVSVAVLVYFLNHIPASIRINTVLEGIGERLLEDIRENYPLNGSSADPEPAPCEGRTIPTGLTGYIEVIDFDELAGIARDCGCSIALEVRTGDFVHPGMALARLYPGDGAGDVDPALAGRIENAFATGASRTPTQDPQFLIDELVEIGLRALSPAINDPFTAITALHWLGAATAELGRRDLRRRCGDLPELARVQPLPETFDHFVERGFGAIRSAVATSPVAAAIMFDTLRSAAGTLDNDARIDLLHGAGVKLLEQARTELAGPDLEAIEDRYRAFLSAFAN